MTSAVCSQTFEQPESKCSKARSPTRTGSSRGSPTRTATKWSCGNRSCGTRKTKTQEVQGRRTTRPMTTIRDCRADEQATILAIINAAAQRYRGIIPADRWHEPYMSDEQLARDIGAGVRFSGYEDDD